MGTSISSGDTISTNNGVTTSNDMDGYALTASMGIRTIVSLKPNTTIEQIRPTVGSKVEYKYEKTNPFYISGEILDDANIGFIVLE